MTGPYSWMEHDASGAGFAELFNRGKSAQGPATGRCRTDRDRVTESVRRTGWVAGALRHGTVARRRSAPSTGVGLSPRPFYTRSVFLICADS